MVLQLNNPLGGMETMVGGVRPDDSAFTSPETEIKPLDLAPAPQESESILEDAQPQEESEPTQLQQPPVQETPTQEQTTAQRIITIMNKGWLDKTPDPGARRSLTSRDWANRAAKAEAKLIIDNPDADYTSFGPTEIWKHVLRAEGGYANNPADPGGETKFGISKAAYPNLDIANLTAAQAQEIFKKDYYDAVGGDTLLKINPGLAAHVSDMAFNAGPGTAIKLMYDAAGLPRESQITPELIDKLDNSEEIVKNYSMARLKYYAGLANAPTFIKGWTNRVSNLNKALNIKSGLNGAYKSAKQLDVSRLVNLVYNSEAQLHHKFAELNDEEVQRLRYANEMLAPGRKRKEVTSSVEQPKQLSSIGEVFKKSYDAKYYLNTIDGMNELAMRSAREASEANRIAMGDKYSPSLSNKLTFGLYGNVNNVDDFEEEVAKFKKEHPEVKLPFNSAADVYALNQKKAKDIQEAYDKLDSGNFSDGIGASMKKLLHVAAGYLPGEILGSMSDTTEAAINLIPLPGATSAVNVAKGAAMVMAGTGAEQAIIQPKRQELGLQGGVKEGVANTVMAGAGQAVIGSLVMLGKSLWSSGSKDAAKEVFKTTERLKKQVAKADATPDTEILKQAIDSIDDQAKRLQNNPHGESFTAKQQYETNMQAAVEDTLAGKPVRQMDTPVTNVIDNSNKIYKQMSMMFDDAPPEAAAQWKQGIAEWNKIKASAVTNDVDLPSTLPYTDKYGNMAMFNTKEEAYNAIGKMKSDRQLFVEQDPNGAGFYLSRVANLEDQNLSTGRFDETGEFADINGKQLVGTAEDIRTAQQYPEYANARETKNATAPLDKYIDYDQYEPHRQYVKDLENYMSTKLQDVDAKYEASLGQFEAIDPTTRIDIGEDTAHSVTIKDMLDGVKEERSALQEMFTCLTQPFSNTQGGM